MKTIVAVICLAVAFEAAALVKGVPVTAAAAEGRAEAESDLRDGKLILRTYGFAAGARTRYAELLLSRLGVRLQAAGGCVVSPDMLAETTAYNDVMKAEIAKRFGRNALEEIARQAAQP